MASSTTTTTKIVEPYHVIEDRITQAIDILRERGGNPNVAAAAREFHVTESRLRGRWNGRKAKSDIILANRKLQEHQELAVCSYLGRLDKIGNPARTFMITGCANSILHRAADGLGISLSFSPYFDPERTFKRTTILSAFRQTGLIPFNPDIVLRKLVVPSTPSPSPPSTPSRHHTELPTVPLTIRPLKRQADQLWYKPPVYTKGRCSSCFRVLARPSFGRSRQGTPPRWARVSGLWVVLQRSNSPVTKVAARC